MCSHNRREPGPKGLVHVSKDVSRACNGSDTRHTITSTRVDQLLIYNRTPGISFSIQHAYFLQIHRRTESFSTAGGHGRVQYLLQKEAQIYSPLLCLAMPEENPSYQMSRSCLPHSVRYFLIPWGGVNLILPHSGSQKRQNWDEVK